MMTKQEAREEMKKRRKAFTGAERAEADWKIRRNLLELEVVKTAENFFSFVSYGTEVDTRELISLLLQQKKRVAVPRVKGRDMDFYQISSLEQMKPGYQGILEPCTQKRVRGENGVMLLPGLAFDEKKHRVGYGGGFYDCYLAGKAGENLITVAVAYDFQLVEHIMTESFDWTPDILVTDKRIIY